MTIPSLAPIIPAAPMSGRRTASPLRGGSLAQQRPMPLPPTPVTRDDSITYALATLDCHGRVADRKVMAALGWTEATALTIRQRQGLIVVDADRDGAFRLTARLFLHLPAAVRGWCGLRSGDRVLLAARSHQGRLVVHPPAVLGAALDELHTRLLDGAS
ncbi:hypothetical protein [Paractinoplanes rishiriensis]|uniref:SpoVT-AbrB domain-containing protein n=1 Tax=Paractinoplanes rishiriensis TaxID=1050105 RepID=A0A919KBA4_9ACTN|nr:hypothetical protein [Actinoplanes rishiriensis]GIF01974.1 hypothetical protein Ari01nite_94380 [Actinoplanes rishiriensis]